MLKKAMPLLLCCLVYSSFSLSNEIQKDNGTSSTSLMLAKALDESGDVSSSHILYYQIIEEKELKKSFDADYIEALYGALSIDLSYGLKNSSQLLNKLQLHDKQNMPTVRFQDGWMIMENIPPEMTKDNGDWIKEILKMFGMSVSDEDIKFHENQISVKFPPCSCCKTQ